MVGMIQVFAQRFVVMAGIFIVAAGMTVATMRIAIVTDQLPPMWIAYGVAILSGVCCGAGVAFLFNRWSDGVWPAIPVAIAAGITSLVCIGLSCG